MRAFVQVLAITSQEKIPRIVSLKRFVVLQTSEAVIAVIPVGNTDLIDTVLLTTTCVTAGATLLILAALRKKKIVTV